MRLLRIGSLRLSRDDLRANVASVVENGNCSGCGACSLLSQSIEMRFSANGYIRPFWRSSAERKVRGKANLFNAICPGVAVRLARPEGAVVHPTMGPFVSAWTAWAADPTVRRIGSSGGVISALSAWLIESGRSSGVVASGPSDREPCKTVPIELRTKEDVLSSAGSRYAPVANAILFDPNAVGRTFVGKPCEVYAARQMANLETGAEESHPLLVSFFCAGVPSQHATDSLVALASMSPESITSATYRGNGWPGRFTLVDSAGRSFSLSYESSWGDHLGPHIQTRCKICPDGIGGHADISVGDFWSAGSNGYPSFEEGDGVSVAIARTRRGHQVLMDARAAGVVALSVVQLDDVARVQPSQVRRLNTMGGRLAGRVLAGKRIPHYSGFSLIGRALRAPRLTVRTLRGSFLRFRGNNVGD